MKNRISAFDVIYDAFSDVLYISRKSENATRGMEDRSGIVWRYNSDGVLVGATIIDFQELWAGRSDDLAAKISEKFDVPVPQAESVVNHVLSHME